MATETHAALESSVSNCFPPEDKFYFIIPTPKIKHHFKKM